MRRRFSRAGALVMAGSIFVYAAPVLAQASASEGSDRSGAIEDIIVTARKKSESLINVPVAVTALSSETIERANATTLQKIGDLAPQVTLVKGFSGSGASFNIRGLGSSFIDAGVEQTVAINVDGVPVGRGNIITQAFFDLEQVEILKGPQALFFGKNSPAGVVSVRTRGPSDRFEGSVRAGYEFVADERYVEAAVGAPLTETLGVRVAGRASKMTGYLVNNAVSIPYPYAPALSTQGAMHRRQPRTESYQGRVTLRWAPTDQFSAELKAFGGNYKDDGTDGYAQTICFSPLTNPVFPPLGGAADPYSDCGLNKNKASAAGPAAITSTIEGYEPDGRSRTNQDVALGSLTLNYESNDITLTSVTGYYHIKSGSTFSAERSSYALFPAFIFEHNNTFTQEFRATSDFSAPLNFTFGLFFESSRFTTGVNALIVPAGPDPVTGSWASSHARSRQKADTYSPFAQLRWSINDQLELAGGVRYTYLKKDVDNFNAFVHSALGPNSALFLPEGIVLRSHIRDHNYSPEATLTWRPTQDLTVYGAFKTGYKSGGASSLNILSPTFTGETLSFRPEKAIGGEVGFKGYLFDRSIRFELTGYSYKYKDLQVTSYDQPSFSFLIQNAASARIKGVELSAEWRATPELTLNGAVGYNKARYISFPLAPCGARSDGDCVPNGTHSLAGNPLVRAPDWSGNAGAVYDVPLGSGLRLGLNADIQFSSKYYTQEDINPLASQDAFVKLNAGVRLHDEDDKWELAFIGRNLTNKYILLYTTDMLLGGANQFLSGSGRPRELAVQGTFRF